LDQQALLKETLQLIDLRQYEKALPGLKKLVKKNDVLAMYHLGVMSYHGYGMEKNANQAFSLLQKAALELHAGAMYYLGKLYEEGCGIAQNFEKAVEYYTAAGLKGNDDAIVRSAEIFDSGKLGERKRQLALELYVELSKKNHPYATYQIGMAYLQGDGVQKSAENAYSWLNKALSLGSIDAMNRFRLIGTKSKNDARSKEDIYIIGKNLVRESKYTQATIYLEIASTEGILDAYLLLAECIEHTTKDLKRAFDLYYKAASLGNPEAMFSLAICYESGIGVSSSAIQAAKWFEKAANEHHVQAKQELVQLRGY
jgi:uncharacterized protein